MKAILKHRNIRALLIALQVGIGYLMPALAQQPVSGTITDPIYGKLMLVGTGEISGSVLATFAYLAKEKEGSLVVLSKAGRSMIKIPAQWQELIGKVSLIELGNSGNNLTKSDLEVIREGTAVWLSEDFSENLAGSEFHMELISLLHRDGLVGGQGTAAESIATFVRHGNSIRDGFNLLPNSLVKATDGNQDQYIKTINTLPGRVGWELPPGSAVVIHSGRQISVIGDTDITLRTPENGDWPERVASFGPPVDDLPYTTDLISWNRSGAARLNKKFPPAVAPVPDVPSGALVIVGGHGYPDGMWERVIKFAGGTNANFVCFAQNPGSTGAEKLRELGCNNVAVYVVRTGPEGIEQAKDPILLEDLKKADAIYFGGGRTYKYMDAYLDTEAHRLMENVLERGGIILGGSAGAQIQGDFLVRGDPRTNKTLWMEGNDVGLGFIKGVIIDVHYRERGRENLLPSLLVKHPQLLGIGIDETTAIWVQGTVAEVLGPHSVTFYDLENVKNLDGSSPKTGNPVVLMAGEKYDLKLRKPIE